MKRLLQINSSANVASTGRLAEDIGSVAIESGWDSYIAYGRHYRPSKSHLIKIGGRVSVFSDVLMTRLFDRHGHGAYIATKLFLQEVERINPDVIQLHNIHGYYLNYPLFFRYVAEKDIPVFWSLHDCWCITGHCAHFVGSNCDRWIDGCNHCPLLKDYPNSWFWDSSSKNYKEKRKLFNSVPRLVMIPTSEWLGGLLRQSHLKEKDIHVIPDGVDTTVFSPRQQEAMGLRKKMGLEKKFVILVSGTVWEDYKGLPEFRKLRQILPDDYAIVFVGMSRKEIEKNAEINNGIIMLPRTDTPIALSVYYTMADCVMSLSRMESFGLTPVEGYACGTPVIVNNSTALPELVTDKTGYVVNSDDVYDIKEKLDLMKSKGKSYYTEACRELAVSKYSKEVAYNKYIALYSHYL